jgi:hypothetical protein
MTPETLARVHEEMRAQDFSIVEDRDFDMPYLHVDIVDWFYQPSIMIPEGDTKGPVADRYRIKDMCVYHRDGDRVTLKPIPDPSLARIGSGDAARNVPRFDFLSLWPVGHFVKQLLNLVPPERRHPKGTFGVHAFRSFSRVVDGPHQDGFEFGATMVLAQVGGGGDSYLIRHGETVLSQRLKPGQILFYEDSKFFHGANPLSGEGCRRDALVIQFDSPEDHAAATDGGML